MEDAKSTEEDEYFIDALDEFPFYDCPDSFESPSPPQSKLSLSSSNGFLSPPDAPSSTTLRRRRRQSLAFRESGKLNSDRAESTSRSVIESGNEEEKKEESSTLMAERSENSPPVRETDDDRHFNFLFFLAELLVKAIGFQFNLFINFITFPMWVFYYSCMLALNPFRVLKLLRNCLMRKLMRLWNGVWNTVSPFVAEWFKEHKALLKLALRCGWGLFWSVYVCSVLVTLLISSFVISGLMMRYYLVEEPFQLTQALNFDYTQSKPVALVPITSCPTEEERGEKNDIGNGSGIRAIPPNQKLQNTVSLILPESDYNRNLGIFQIRVEFLSENGKSLASLSHPGMLEFKSKPIRLFSTFFKIIPLVAGYVSEAQTVILKFRGYREGYIPTACVKVTIEQRVEYRAGAGIPEVYDAFLYLESELPFLKRILWYWRRTLFVWLAMVVFVVELLFALVFCRPIVIPRSRTRSDVAANSGPQASSLVQR